MCGFIFCYSAIKSATQLQPAAKKALQKLQHRGPDEAGIVYGDNWIAGHRRLSIIDIQQSQQPFQSYNKRYTLVFNGEIYNYRELRAQLEINWKFASNGDTEVLFAGLLLYGEAFISRLDGMWSFLFWDNLEQKLLMSRDRSGKKPLYFQFQGTSCSMASELPALSLLSDNAWTEDIDSTADYFRYGYYLPGKTAYENINEVLPAHYIIWSPNKEFIQKPYWQLLITPYTGSINNAAEDLYSCFDNAVKKRLVSDVEIGCFLSGGIDSSLVTAFAAKNTPHSLKTFTIGFKSASYDERKYANTISQQLNTEHYEFVLSHWDESLLYEIINNYIGQPFQDPSVLPTAYVSELASQQVKVVLTGDGSDELFCGYQRYKARALIHWFNKSPGMLQDFFHSIIKKHPEPTSHHSRSLLKKAHLFKNILERKDYNSKYIAPIFSSNQQLKLLWPDLIDRGHQITHIPESNHFDDIQQMMFSDFHIYLAQDIHTKVDRASMKYSIECRAPFMDTKLIELAYSLPEKWHFSLLNNKPMLHRAFKNKTELNKKIWSRNKQGFSVPLGSWFKHNLGDSLLNLLHDYDNDALNSKKAIQILTDHKEGKHDHGNTLWLIMQYLIWKKNLNSGIGH